jgi:hypothetical protein
VYKFFSFATLSISPSSIKRLANSQEVIVLPAPGAALIRKCLSVFVTTNHLIALLIAFSCQARNFNAILLPFCKLHFSQRACPLLTSVLPPLDHGIT